MTSASAPFSDVFTSALRGEVCHVLGLGDLPLRLPVGAWLRNADPGDAAVLAQCIGPTIDVGCGPGRMTELLAESGHAVLGIDVVPEAVFQTRERGVSALLRDVFDDLPGEGRWSTALLADGNIGIGGDPCALLRRVAGLLEPDGRVVVDLEPPGTGLHSRTIRLATRSRRSEEFPWALVGVDAIAEVAAGAGLAVAGLHQHQERWFAVLNRAR